MTDPMLLILNLGSTSTKVGVFDGPTCRFSETIRHGADDLKGFRRVAEQHDLRMTAIRKLLHDHAVDLSRLAAVVSRGGLIKPLPGGVYAISPQLVADAKSGRYGEHACNLGCEIAFNLGRELRIPPFTVDPPTSDDLCAQARVTGLPQIRRRSVYHALNQRAIARRLAADLGKSIEALDAVVVHLGGGISVGAHAGGRVIDVNNALDGDGPFAPERAGALPSGDLVALCFSGRHAREDVMKMLAGRGGLVAHLGTTDGKEIEARIEAGDGKARATVEAMAYHVAKEIGAAATVLKGKVDAIALTGGLANWSRLTGLISDRVAFIAPVKLYPGEDELGALAAGALRVLAGEEIAREYA